LFFGFQTGNLGKNVGEKKEVFKFIYKDEIDSSCNLPKKK